MDGPIFMNTTELPHNPEHKTETNIIQLSSIKYLLACTTLSVILIAAGPLLTLPSWIIALEVLLTILALFIFGSIKYQLDKNALTYGAVLVITASYFPQWWNQSFLKISFDQQQFSTLIPFIQQHFLSLHGLNELIHADTMLFILGLTLFVSVIAQTRILETFSFKILNKNKGAVLPTLALLTGMVAFSSGILDGVSMIGLMIRTMVIILFLAKAKDEAVIYAVMISTIITTVCGMWLAYGEPPNLIMKANLHPHLDNAFFLRYCLPAAILSYCVVFWNIKRKLKGIKVNNAELDVLDLHTDDVRFLQAVKHGEVLTAVEFLDSYEKKLGTYLEALTHRLHQGEPLGSAMIHENVPQPLRIEMLGAFVDENLAAALDEHYQHTTQNNHEHKDRTLQQIRTILNSISQQKQRSQIIGGLSFVPFIGLLICHAMNHHIPLFLASFAGFITAFIGIFKIPKMRTLAFREAKHEYQEYLFLFPLFFSITLLQKTGFFETLSQLMNIGIATIGVSHIAWIQLMGATFLSAILDNNIVADFASRSLHHLNVTVLHLFALAQIAGYAVGGCWTHIGSAQSVVAYAFIKKEVNAQFTPFQWIKFITPIILEILILLTLLIYIESFILNL